MTKYALDAASLIRLLEDDRPIGEGNSLVAPALVRSDVLAAVYTDVRDARRSEKEGRAMLERLAECKIRLLGDRVSRAKAWRIATAAGWEDIAPAEYLAVASLQADALVAVDARIRSGAENLVRLAAYDDLFR